MIIFEYFFNKSNFLKKELSFRTIPKKQLKNKNEISETGDILRLINYIVIILVSIFLFLIKRKTIAVAFLIIWLINSLLISLYTKEIKLKRDNKITLKKDKKLFIAYQISLIIGIIVLILLDLKLIIE
jgi:hypothetical protein